MEERLYSINEIFRLGLLKNHMGDAYKSLGAISHIVSRLGYTKKFKRGGFAKCLTMEQIEHYNRTHEYADTK